MSSQPKIVPFPTPTPLPDGPLALSVAEVAERLSVSESTVRNYINAGHIPSIRWAGRVIVPVSGLIAAMHKATEWQT